ncbi:unnamed protein product [Adineta steineri]|uniref:Uncharacterized protein n=1 Tax=Adineta steineri TaxID=433720 RepID=A0A813RWF0_9BILA|nr:unnamed protein product [Adineta steineri]
MIIRCQLSAAYLFGLSLHSIHAELWGYNSALTYQALGGMFFVLHGYKIWMLTLYGSLMTLIVQTCISSFLNPVGMPTLTFLSPLRCCKFWLLNCSKKKIISVKIVSNFNGFIYEGNLDAIRCLISCGLNPNNDDYDGKNALHLAIVTNHYDIVRFLIENNQVYCVGYDYRSILHVAATNENLEKISSKNHFQQILLRQDRWGFCPIDEARESHFYHTGNELQQISFKENDFYLNFESI